MHFPHQIVISQTTTYAAFLWKHKAFSNADKLSFVSIQELTEDHRLILEDLSTANAKKYQSFSNLVFEAVSPDAVKRIIGALARSSIKCRSLIVVGQDSTPESAAAAFSIASEEKLCSDVGFHDAQPDTIKAALSIKNFSMRRLTLRRLDLDSVQVAIEAIPTEISELGFYDLQRSAVIRALSVISDKQKSQLKQMGICGDTEASEVIINFAFKLPSLIG